MSARSTLGPPALRTVTARPEGLVYEVPAPADRVVDVLLDGRRVWSFREAADARPPEGSDDPLQRFEPWPAALVPHLRGTFEVTLQVVAVDGEAVPADPAAPTTTVSLDGSPEPLVLADVHGQPLVVNKWGRLGHALGDAGRDMVERMLDSLDAVREALEARLGPTVFVTGGTLLGPVREDGRVLPHDDDADLAYLSRHSHPADVTLEAFEIGRVLRAAGFEVVRLSAAHVQLMFDHEGVPDHYVDVFTGFLLEGHWYQHFAIRTPAGRDVVLPTVPLEVEGRVQPAPRDGERMLLELFGPGWRVPDPAYTFTIPPETGERFYGWFADYNVERERWDDEVLLAPAPPEPPRTPSAFARAVADRTPAGSPVLDLGCGLGGDALAFAAEGRTVRALDFSRAAVDRLRAAAAERGVDLTADVLNLLDIRAVVRLGAETAARPDAWTVYGRRLLNALEDRGRENVWRLCAMLLRRGGAAHFDLVADPGYPGIAPYRHLTLDQVVAEADRHGLVLEDAVRITEPVSWAGAPEEELVEVWRTTLRRRPR
ncbi:SAM-dependent methyltransferase [Blastococcus sp. SYSU D00820]